MGPTVGLETVGRKKSLASVENRTTAVQPLTAAISTELSRLLEGGGGCIY
jgi:hypothetical protein